MAADTSSPAAAISQVVEAAAAALASLSDEPMPATSAADAVSMSGAASTYDIVCSQPGRCRPSQICRYADGDADMKLASVYFDALVTYPARVRR